MNKSSVQLFNGQLFESKHAIEAYCHFLRLLIYFINIYPELGKLNLFFYSFNFSCGFVFVRS